MTTTADTFNIDIIPRIAAKLDPEHEKLSWAQYHYNPTFPELNEWRYRGPTDPAAAKAAFEPLVRDMAEPARQESGCFISQVGQERERLCLYG